MDVCPPAFGGRGGVHVVSEVVRNRMRANCLNNKEFVLRSGSEYSLVKLQT